MEDKTQLLIEISIEMHHTQYFINNKYTIVKSKKQSNPVSTYSYLMMEMYLEEAF